MASTSMTLGPHWEAFIREAVESGRYATASEVVRDALRLLEIRQHKLEALRAHLAEGFDQAERGEFVDDFSMERLIVEMDAEEEAAGEPAVAE